MAACRLLGRSVCNIKKTSFVLQNQLNHTVRSARSIQRSSRDGTEAFDDSGVYSQTSLLEKYLSAKQACEALPTPEVNPFGVFANNELDISQIEVYGFDYDYTLAVYTEKLHYLIYDLGRDWLINKFKYPKDIAQLEYRPGFAIRGLQYDMKKGVLMKMDLFHQIQFCSVYRGLTPLSSEEVINTYGGSYIPQYMIRGNAEQGARMKQLNDLFSVPEICLLSNVTEYFERHNIAYNPEILFFDIQNAISSIHPVIHNTLNESNINDYLEKRRELVTFLERLKSADKQMFLVTNSPFKFVDVGMRYMIGPEWQDLFDVVIVQARKPKFFTDQHRYVQPFRVYDPETKSQLWERVTKLEKNKVYIEGTVTQLQAMTGWCGNSVLYFGDQIYSDLADLTLNYGWRTGAIIWELANEIKILNSEEFRHTVSWLQSLQHLIEEMQDHEDIEDFIEQLLQERDQLRKTTKSLFNPNFGSIFRTHHNPTYFSRRLFRYSDIYMSHVTNLLNYSLRHTFYPRRGALPHECHTPHS
ncbi:5'-nucleotidase domain-containing protein 3-like isoform X1 [Dermacentor silvarum]|uniref:5'-nucleotidase domain-containing protein 3-like isoform X1 n=1 Tax=Dermacentor silvarum TaxID=543639 RepID=UPI0021007FB8|nr:5'-nucleotidase domain-containing protein 3-like isoform X1 [Dermacentor silvarum]